MWGGVCRGCGGCVRVCGCADPVGGPNVNGQTGSAQIFMKPDTYRQCIARLKAPVRRHSLCRAVRHQRGSHEYAGHPAGRRCGRRPGRGRGRGWARRRDARGEFRRAIPRRRRAAPAAAADDVASELLGPLLGASRVFPGGYTGSGGSGDATGVGGPGAGAHGANSGKANLRIFLTTS